MIILLIVTILRPLLRFFIFLLVFAFRTGLCPLRSGARPSCPSMLRCVYRRAGLGGHPAPKVQQSRHASGIEAEDGRIARKTHEGGGALGMKRPVV